MSRSLGTVVAFALVASFSGSSNAAPEGPSASLGAATATCERVAGPGRVRCDVELSTPGASVRWADVMIVETPPFVSALKGRLGPADTTAREKDKWRFSFGLVARARGTGDVRLQVRAVVCRAGAAGDPAGDRCEAALLPVVATVVSGGA